MKRLMILLNCMFLLSSCVSATLPPRSQQRVVVVTSRPVKHRLGHKKTVVVKRVEIGTRIKTIPAKQVVIYFNKSPYIYAEGVFYRKLSSKEYEVVKPQLGMVVPQLPQYNVEKVCIKGETLFLFDGTLYKQIPTSQGVQYQVNGFMN